MTKKEWLIHILNGGKGISNCASIGNQFVEFKNNKFIYSNDDLCDIDYHTKDFAIYKEPKKLIKIAPYIFKDDTSDHYVQTWTYFKDDMTFLKLYKDKDIKFQRLTTLEIEVEDYERD
jgi:hypothetical protein